MVCNSNTILALLIQIHTNSLHRVKLVCKQGVCVKEKKLEFFCETSHSVLSTPIGESIQL